MLFSDTKNMMREQPYGAIAIGNHALAHLVVGI
jgi:hypothetical protein